MLGFLCFSLTIGIWLLGGFYLCKLHPVLGGAYFLLTAIVGGLMIIAESD